MITQRGAVIPLLSRRVKGPEPSSGCPVRVLCFFTAQVLPGYTTKCSRYAGARASSLRTWSARLTTCPRSCFLWSRASASRFFRQCTSLGPCRWTGVILPVAAHFRATRVRYELAAGRALVAHSRSFSRSRAEAAGGDPGSDGGKTGRKENARGTQAVTSITSMSSGTGPRKSAFSSPSFRDIELGRRFPKIEPSLLASVRKNRHR